MARLTGTLLLIAAVAGCQPATPDALLGDYLTRLSRLTDVPVRLAEPETLAPYPQRRALRRQIPERTIDVVEFFELHGCDMGALVGFRNSPLGRVQGDSQRLGYEATWLAAADRCGDGAEWLRELSDHKRQWLPALYWNATFAGSEIATAMGAAGAPAAGDLADLLRGLNDSLTSLEQGTFDVAAFEQQLGRLRLGSWVGPARQDWARWRRYLAAAGALLDAATPGLCLNQQPTPRSRYLQNVFLKFYVGRIQPDLAVSLRRHEAWIVELKRLTRRLRPVQPAAFSDWYGAVLDPDQDASEWRRTRSAVVDHARAWQRLLAGCGIEPGAGLRQD